MPFQDILKVVNGEKVPYCFHEAGVYIGILGAIIVISFLSFTRKKMFIAYIFIAVFFFWMGSGWLSDINPWHLFQKIPIVKNAHVQSRFFVISYLVFVILLCFALDYFKTKIHKVFLFSIILFLIVESLFVSSYPFYKVFKYKSSTCETSVFKNLITSTTIEKTVADASDNWRFDFLHYYNSNTGAKASYEPAIIQGDIKSVDDQGYKGEIYLTKGRGIANIQSYTPGKIKIKYSLDTISEFQINTNYLLGWRSNDNNLKVFESNGLLTISPRNLNGEVEVLYRPNYLKIILPLFLMGLILSIFILIKIKRNY